MCKIERRVIEIVHIDGHRRAVTPDEAEKIRAEFHSERQQDLAFVSSPTFQCGRIDPLQRVSRCVFTGTNWIRKEPDERSRGCGRGDKGLRSKTRSRRRQGLLNSVMNDADVDILGDLALHLQ